MPSSISTVRCVGLPSSSMLSDPRRSGIVPSSTTVTPAAATRWPMRFENAEVPLRLKSPSSPCPIASCSRTPGQPGPSTTVIVPAGAAHMVERGYGRLALAAYGARRGRSLRERVETDVVGIRECGLFTRYRADSDAAVDRIRSRLDDAFLEAPAFEARILEIEIGVVDVMHVYVGEHLRELPEFERRRREQELRRLVEQRRVESRNGEMGHGGPWLGSRHQSCIVGAWRPENKS